MNLSNTTHEIFLCFLFPYHIFEYESERGLCMNNVVQCDDVCVFELLEQRSLSDGREWSAFLFLETNLLQSYNLVCQTERKANWCWSTNTVHTVEKRIGIKIRGNILVVHILWNKSQNIIKVSSLHF